MLDVPEVPPRGQLGRKEGMQAVRGSKATRRNRQRGGRGSMEVDSVVVDDELETLRDLLADPDKYEKFEGAGEERR